MASHVQITEETLSQGLQYLTEKDPHLAQVVSSFGAPPIWGRKPGFSTLIHLILEQQVSLASAKAAFDKLNDKVTALTPKNFLALNDDELKDAGFSRQKMQYSRGLATAILEKRLHLKGLDHADDETVRDQLTQIKGIGPWTSDIYLLMALGRPDVWPVGDLALVIAMREVKGLRQNPTREKMTKLAAPWRPWRSVAARVLWHHYLTKRNIKI